MNDSQMMIITMISISISSFALGFAIASYICK